MCVGRAGPRQKKDGPTRSNEQWCENANARRARGLCGDGAVESFYMLVIRPSRVAGTRNGARVLPAGADNKAQKKHRPGVSHRLLTRSKIRVRAPPMQRRAGVKGAPSVNTPARQSVARPRSTAQWCGRQGMGQGPVGSLSAYGRAVIFKWLGCAKARKECCVCVRKR